MSDELGKLRAPRLKRPGRVATTVATLTGSVYLIVGTLVLATLALLIGWIPPRGYVVFWVARAWARGVLLSSGVRAPVRFEGRLDPKASYVFMANHTSLFDIPVLLSTLPAQTRFLAKRSLFQIPIFGWALMLGGFVNIDRKNLGTARSSFSSAIDRLDEGVSLLVFPEGTRSLQEGMLPFKRGGFLLALKSGLPIVPVGISGSARVQRKGNFAIRPQPIRVHYGLPIEVGDYTVRDKQQLMDEVRRRIESLCE